MRIIRILAAMGPSRNRSRVFGSTSAHCEVGGDSEAEAVTKPRPAFRSPQHEPGGTGGFREAIQRMEAETMNSETQILRFFLSEIAAIRASGAWVHFNSAKGHWCAMRLTDTISMGVGATAQEAIEALEAQG